MSHGFNIRVRVMVLFDKSSFSDSFCYSIPAVNFEPLEFLCPLYISFLKKIWRTLVSFVGPLIALLHSVLYALLVTSALGFKSRVNFVSSKETRIRTPISGTGFLSHELTS